jgi:hypothetical protein
LSSTYLLSVILFSVFLKMAGTVCLFTDSAMGLLGRAQGSAAKVATTGQFTVTLMKRLGYRPVFAGGLRQPVIGWSDHTACQGRCGRHHGQRRWMSDVPRRAGRDDPRDPLLPVGFPDGPPSLLPDGGLAAMDVSVAGTLVGLNIDTMTLTGAANTFGQLFVLVGQSSLFLPPLLTIPTCIPLAISAPTVPNYIAAAACFAAARTVTANDLKISFKLLNVAAVGFIILFGGGMTCLAVGAAVLSQVSPTLSAERNTRSRADLRTGGVARYGHIPDTRHRTRPRAWHGTAKLARTEGRSRTLCLCTCHRAAFGPVHIDGDWHARGRSALVQANMKWSTCPLYRAENPTSRHPP